ncbi:MAG TPA: alpha/beta fold hydrolase [Kofleriaceae bacterium]|nr:alpha/beta fold hydrolase [Kofleriaceae bacterium]
MKSGAGEWLRGAPNPHARMRLVCLPYAGASSATYHGWGRALGSDVEVRAVDLPGRSQRIREPLVLRIAPLVESLCDALGELDDKPLALFGYSMGALLGFELARALRRRRRGEPSLIMVAAGIAPHLGWMHGARLHTIADDEHFLAELTRRYGPVAPELLAHPDMRQLVLRLMRADLAALESYVHSMEPALRCPLIAFGGCDDRATPREGLEGWRLHTEGRFELFLFPGDHFFLRSATGALLAEVRRQLASVTAPGWFTRGAPQEVR